MVNLFEKFANAMETVYVRESLVAGRLSDNYEFTGAKTVRVMTPQTVPMEDYKRTGSNRYGDPQEVQDIVQELTMTQDKSFSLTIDKGNFKDQGALKTAGKMMRLQITERAIPESDRYCLEKLAYNGGIIAGNGTAPTKSTIADRISAGTQALDDAEVPQDGRTLFINSTGYKLLKHSDEFLAVEKLAEKAIAKGEVGTYDNMTVVKVPAGRWPANVNFMIVHKRAATHPVKINETKLHKDPPGISGNLLEGRQYYDCFVLGAKAEGIYVDVDTASGKATVCATPAISSAGAISGTSGDSFKFTTDGSDPRYSDSAQVGTTAPTTAGTVVKAYAYKAGCFPSAVTEKAF